MIENIPLYGLLRSVLKWIPPFLIRRFYPADRLAQLIYLDLQPRYEAVRIDLGSAATARVVLQLINLSPFPVQIDRASFRLMFAGATISMAFLERKALAIGEPTSLYLEAAVPDGFANQMARIWKGQTAWLEGHIDFNCSVREFAKPVRTLSQIPVAVINEGARA